MPSELDTFPHAKALILLTSRPETVGIAVEKLRPVVIGVIASLDILETAALERSEQKVKFVDMVMRVREI